jgi:hypothetical protein
LQIFNITAEETELHMDNNQLRHSDHVTNHFKNRAYTASIFIDVSKAYDTVWNTRLLQKFHTAGLLDSMLHFVKSYLIGQKLGLNWIAIPQN